MPKPVIAIDMDEVLIPYRPYFLEYHKLTHGLDMSIEEFHGYMKELEKDRAALLDRIADYVSSKIPDWKQPMPGAFDSIMKLKDKYEVEIVTARFKEGIPGIPTSEEWVAEHFPQVFNNVHFTKVKDSDESIPKWQICKEIDAVCLIDDHLTNVLGCAENGIKSILFGDYPWNQADELPDLVTRVTDWNGVLEVLL